MFVLTETLRWTACRSILLCFVQLNDEHSPDTVSVVSFVVGFMLLPFVWAINSVWFFDEAFRKPPYEEQKTIKKCKYSTVEYTKHSNRFNFSTYFDSVFHIVNIQDVIMSAFGALLWAIALGTWITIFHMNRAAWGEYADNLSFLIPLGEA